MADAVVVGGGSAGYVLAARLREDAACRMVLLEAGQDLAGVADAPPDVLDAPVPTLAHDWGYLAEPSPLGRRATLPPARGELVRPGPPGPRCSGMPQTAVHAHQLTGSRPQFRRRHRAEAPNWQSGAELVREPTVGSRQIFGRSLAPRNISHAALHSLALARVRDPPIRACAGFSRTFS